MGLEYPGNIHLYDWYSPINRDGYKRDIFYVFIRLQILKGLFLFLLLSESIWSFSTKLRLLLDSYLCLVTFKDIKYIFAMALLLVQVTIVGTIWLLQVFYIFRTNTLFELLGAVLEVLLVLKLPELISKVYEWWLLSGCFINVFAGGS